MLGLPVACTAGDDKVVLRIGKKSTYASGVRSTITETQSRHIFAVPSNPNTKTGQSNSKCRSVEALAG